MSVLGDRIEQRDEKIAELKAQRDQARSIAVRLEQDCAAQAQVLRWVADRHREDTEHGTCMTCLREGEDGIAERVPWPCDEARWTVQPDPVFAADDPWAGAA